MKAINCRADFFLAPEARQALAQRVSAGYVWYIERGAPEVRHVSHSYAQNVVHLVFSTKDRKKAIDREFRPKLWVYVTGICRKLDIYVHSIGGMEDHIHLLVQVPPVLTLSKAVATIKANSSGWASEQGDKFAWQQGYGAFSVSASVIPIVIRYIQNQEEHHKKMDFEAEFVALLKKHGVEFDPKYVLG
jgi:putative transposase